MANLGSCWCAAVTLVCVNYCYMCYINYMPLWVDSMNKMILNILQSSEPVSFPFGMVLFTVDLYTGSLHPSNTQSCMNERPIALNAGQCEMLQQPTQRRAAKTHPKQ